MAMNEKQAAHHIRMTVLDSTGMGVWTAGYFMHVLDAIRDVDGAVKEDERTFQNALDNLVDEGVMERVGRDGYQVREDWLAEQGVELEGFDK